MFILVRRDLPPGQQAVQACHAVAEFMARPDDDGEVGDWQASHKTMVVLGVRDEGELEGWERGLKARKVAYATFAEPDLGGAKTAIAIHPFVDPKLFRRLELL